MNTLEQKFPKEKLDEVEKLAEDRPEGFKERILETLGMATGNVERQLSSLREKLRKSKLGKIADKLKYLSTNPKDKGTAGNVIEADLEKYLGRSDLFADKNEPNIDIESTAGIKTKLKAIGLDADKHTNYEVKNNAESSLRSKGVKQMLAHHGVLSTLIQGFDPDETAEIVAAGNISSDHQGALAVPSKGGGIENKKTSFGLSTVPFADSKAQIAQHLPNLVKEDLVEKRISAAINVDYYDPDLLAQEMANKAKGYVPNFSHDGLSEAIKREHAAGIPEQNIRVGQDPRLTTPQNPEGLGVWNDLQETSLSHGMSLASQAARRVLRA